MSDVLVDHAGKGGPLARGDGIVSSRREKLFYLTGDNAYERFDAI